MEAKLIGYDETPIDVISLKAIKCENLEVLEPSGSNLYSTTLAKDEAPTKSCSPCIRCIDRSPPALIKAAAGRLNESIGDNCCDTELQNPGGSHRGWAKSRLYEICAANYWLNVARRKDRAT